MRTATMLGLLLVAVTAVLLTADRSDVDSQVSERPWRIRIAGLAANDRIVGPVDPPPDALWFTVIIEVTALDAEPEACCQPPTQILLIGSDFLTEGTTIQTNWNSVEFTQHPQPDLEGCIWTRVVEDFGVQIAMQGSGLWGGPGQGDPVVHLTVYHPRWYYRISGCRDITGGADTQQRKMDEYLRAMFPNVPAGLIFDTPRNPGTHPPCITHYHASSGVAQYVSAKIQIFIHTASCNIPRPPFPF